MRFGILIPQDAPFPELVRRWQLAEELGFDDAYVADHTADYRDNAGYWLDGWTVLAAMAVHTSRIRIGTLVSNPILRAPALLAKEAVSIDHLSGGRLELGIGTGIAGFDHAAVGSAEWAPRERVERFAEYIPAVDGLLRGEGTFAGRYYRSAAATSPAPRQRPRPPITVAGQSPTVRRVAARYADCWNTHGPFGKGMDEILEITRRQNEELDEQCVSYGRKPSDVRRSLLCFDSLDAWSAPDALDKIVSLFSEAGIQEFVLFWPPEDGLLEQAAERIRVLRRT